MAVGGEEGQLAGGSWQAGSRHAVNVQWRERCFLPTASCLLLLLFPLHFGA